MEPRVPFETFKGPICRGCIALGSACGTCEKCLWEKANIAQGSGNSRKIQTLNMNGAVITPATLARIATILETDGEILVVNASTIQPAGGSAFYLGRFMEKAIAAQKEGKL